MEKFRGVIQVVVQSTLKSECSSTGYPVSQLLFTIEYFVCTV